MSHETAGLRAVDPAGNYHRLPTIFWAPVLSSCGSRRAARAGSRVDRDLLGSVFLAAICDSADPFARALGPSSREPHRDPDRVAPPNLHGSNAHR